MVARHLVWIAQSCACHWSSKKNYGIIPRIPQHTSTDNCFWKQIYAVSQRAEPGITKMEWESQILANPELTLLPVQGFLAIPDQQDLKIAMNVISLYFLNPLFSQMEVFITANLSSPNMDMFFWRQIICLVVNQVPENQDYKWSHCWEYLSSRLHTLNFELAAATRREFENVSIGKEVIFCCLEE